MDWLPPIEVSRISDGGKVKPHKELLLMLKESSLYYASLSSGIIASFFHCEWLSKVKVERRALLLIDPCQLAKRHCTP
jgi:hypothetical protein